MNENEKKNNYEDLFNFSPPNANLFTTAAAAEPEEIFNGRQNDKAL